MHKTSLGIKIPYNRFADVQKHLNNVEAIDYFFAKQFTDILFNRFINNTNNSETINIANHQYECLFHLLIALSVSLREGHSCLPLNVVAEQRFGYCCDAFGVVSHQGFQFPSFIHLHELLCLLNIDESQEHGVVFHQEKLYLRRYYNFEQQVIEFLHSHQSNAKNNKKHLVADNLALIETTTSSDTNEIMACLALLFPNQSNSDTALIDWQKIAVANALNKSFSIIAGGPGTGKTYTVTKLLAAIIMLNKAPALTISLVAPTGKAAQRLCESINQAKDGFKALLPEEVLAKIPTETKTIHRLLGVIPNSPNFRHHQENKLNIDVLLIDEVSMVDLPLMARVFRALPAHCQVILLGDAQQLPSVAAGSVLSDLTPFHQAQYSPDNKKFLEKVTGITNLPINKKCPVDHLTYLTHSRRFDGKGAIGILSQLVIAGDSEQSWQLLQSAINSGNPQLTFIEQTQEFSSQASWFNHLIDEYYQPIRAAESVEQAFHLLSKFRFLSATRQGETGVETINNLVESRLLPELSHLINHRSHNKSHSKNSLYHGKPIMINENDYSLGLYNGDIGLIWQNDKGHLMAFFEQQNGQLTQILPSRLPQFETVYAMTIHKTQGSEFNHVALILPTNTDNQLLTRELLYTGITRAKEQITLQSKKSVWYQGVESRVARFSGININQ
ncbi:exodeoxyribonuclease V subunit alpha [Colwellia sp. 1_MG-2023]|uniref:exodeoxyribonuclease V subunit alpha n=1 Tax=Colwellia sp. 1_MG-2023 TaxID=3062649 RepID=UPI0026E18F80|nr:exodeoxyribonuclease V subunit alpha [Colwellia sp. 1_MG-2023]MDO6447297.1 exodeoxyribonuclease V subunit alpha [Colwellia sp. 1_MG-2023]